MGEMAKPRLVEKRVVHPAVEAFDAAVLHRLARRDVVPFDLVLGAPLQDRVRRRFGPVVADDHPRLASPACRGVRSAPSTPRHAGRPEIEVRRSRQGIPV